MAITAAMPSGPVLFIAGENTRKNNMVSRAEEHSALFGASGLAYGGVQAVFFLSAIYSTFMQRAYDILIHDSALQRSECCALAWTGLISGDDGPIIMAV